MSDYDFERTIVEHPTEEEKGTSLVDSLKIATIALGGTILGSEKSDMDCVCENCGCDKIQEKYWVEINSKKVIDYVDDEDDYPNYCPECGDNVNAIYRRDFDYDETGEAELKIGDKVKISEHSEFYDDGSDDNPVDEVGKVISVSDGEYTEMPIKVQWKENSTNVYTRKDLIKVS